MADIACLHHVGDRADGVLDRHRRVKTGWAVDVDVLGIGGVSARGTSSPLQAARRNRANFQRGRAARRI